MPNRSLPEHLASTQREWKTKKRADFRKVKKAFEDFRLGCAYTPVYEHEDRGATFRELEAAINTLSDRLSIKAWGR